MEKMKIIKTIPCVKNLIQELDLKQQELDLRKSELMKITEKFEVIETLNKKLSKKNYELEYINEELFTGIKKKRAENEKIEISNRELEETIECMKDEQNVLEADIDALKQKIEAVYLEKKSLEEKVKDIDSENNALKKAYGDKLSKMTVEKFDSAEFWDHNYKNGGTSGTGSYNRLARFKADTIKRFIDENRVKRVIEFGCGDGNVLSMIGYPEYTGVDVSKYIIEKHKNHYKSDKSKKFYTTQEREVYMNEKYELAISMDVVFHLIEENIYSNYMNDLFNSSKKYVVIYSSNHEEITVWREYRHRNFVNYVQKNLKDWKLIRFIPNEYPYIIGEEGETSASDFYIFEKNIRECSNERN